jgi:hypothetical protein
MIFKNVSEQDLNDALKTINKKYDGNVIWNRFDRQGNQFAVTLRVESSKKPGHSLGHMQSSKTGEYRRLTSACWHVHGDFFDALLSINPKAVIKSAGKTIDVDGGNWQDWSAGSIMYPRRASEKCDCISNGFKSRMVSQSSLSAECWGVQVWGLDHCITCEYKDTQDCGGQDIRKTGKNEKGLGIPI